MINLRPVNRFVCSYFKPTFRKNTKDLVYFFCDGKENIKSFVFSSSKVKA